MPLIPTDENTSLPPERDNRDDFLAEPGDFPADRQTTITQSVPVIVLPAESVSSIHEPRCRDPDVHIMLPPLLQLKSISDRFTKLALSTTTTATSRRGGRGGGGGGGDGSQDLGTAGSSSSRLVLAANMHGALRIGVTTAALKIESRWEGLINPELDPDEVEGGEEGVSRHASTLMKEKEGDEAWAVVRVEGRDWGRVLGVGRLGGKVIACEFFLSPPPPKFSNPLFKTLTSHDPPRFLSNNPRTRSYTGYRLHALTSTFLQASATSTL